MVRRVAKMDSYRGKFAARRRWIVSEQSAMTVRVEQLLAQLRAGQLEARGELLETACNRLLAITRKMKRSFPEVAKWEQTQDVLASASDRLSATLAKVEIKDALHFFRLAAVEIRRELLDLAKRYQGTGDPPTKTGSDDTRPMPSAAKRRPVAAEETYDPRKAAQWAEFHEAIEKLPDPEREVTELLWYNSLSHRDAAELLQVDEPTIRRRWRSARLALHKVLQGQQLPS
jgi:RNA polymerase sigma-70 factor (ECF subfamily)